MDAWQIWYNPYIMEEPYLTPTETQSSSLDLIARLVRVADQVMEIESFRQPLAEPDGRGRSSSASVALEIRGRLRLPSELAFDYVTERFRELGHTALLRRAADAHVILAVPGELPTGSGNQRLAIGLFFATVVSVMFAGMQAGPDGQIDWLSG